MSMRKQILTFNDKHKHLPEIGIIFCGNHAVVSWRKPGMSPKGHTNVYFGLFFFIRLGLICARVYRKFIGK